MSTLDLATRWYEHHCALEQARTELKRAEAEVERAASAIHPYDTELRKLVGRNIERRLFKIDPGTFVLVEQHYTNGQGYTTISVLALEAA